MRINTRTCKYMLDAADLRDAARANRLFASIVEHWPVKAVADAASEVLDDMAKVLDKVIPAPNEPGVDTEVDAG